MNDGPVIKCRKGPQRLTISALFSNSSSRPVGLLFFSDKVINSSVVKDHDIDSEQSFTYNVIINNNIIVFFFQHVKDCRLYRSCQNLHRSARSCQPVKGSHEVIRSR